MSNLNNDNNFQFNQLILKRLKFIFINDNSLAYYYHLNKGSHNNHFHMNLLN